MPVYSPYPDLGEIIALIGEAGQRLAEIEASEGAAGNISVYLGWQVDPRRRFPLEQTISLPTPVSQQLEGVFLVTGSGRRLREIAHDPEANLGAVRLNPDGQTATLYTSPRRLFERLTSEFNSHLAVHIDQIQRTGTNFHALIHAQPLHLTYLSHIPRYQNEQYLNRRILRWQPECIVQLPEGVGLVPFLLPGSDELMRMTTEKLRSHRVVVWAKHGVMARSDASVKRALDRIEYAETGARYEYLNLINGEQAEGLTPEEIRDLCENLGIEQKVF